ncbi:SAM-dependent methyltransferase [Clostridium estertheticum]|nr:SAM-dependent methyltransferase [Clostridium estertheticum]
MFTLVELFTEHITKAVVTQIVDVIDAYGYVAIH